MSKTVAEALREQEAFKTKALEEAYLDLRCLTLHIMEYPTHNSAVNDSIKAIFSTVILATRPSPISQDETNRILAALVEQSDFNYLDLAEQTPDGIRQIVRKNLWMLEVGLA